jgi:hypothetical protein
MKQEERRIGREMRKADEEGSEKDRKRNEEER